MVCSGWRFDGWPLLKRHEEAVRALFAPAPRFAKVADGFVGAQRAHLDVLIGVFVRQRDYRLWAEGRFFFELDRYSRWITEVIALFPGHRVGFIVASDEVLPAGAWSGLPVEYCTGRANACGHWFENFLELAACDYVMSPPSTFAACAAFLGKRPLWPPRRSDQVLSTEQILSAHLFSASRDPDFSQAVK